LRYSFRPLREIVAAGSLLFLAVAPCRPQSTADSPGSPASEKSPASLHDEAEEQLKQEEAQRVMRIIPNFNTSFIPNAAPLSARQKFELAFRGAVDPFQFAAAAIDGAISQSRNGFDGYGEGAQGYAKRFGASYADSFDSAMIGNALLPVLLRQDPRYFRKGTGGFANRFFYAISTSVRCRNDKGKWVPNYSDLLGSLAAGGISNLYYPASDRGVGLTLQRAMTQAGEGAIGAVFFEFWPDISRKFFGSH